MKTGIAVLAIVMVVFVSGCASQQEKEIKTPLDLSNVTAKIFAENTQGWKQKNASATEAYFVISKTNHVSVLIKEGTDMDSIIKKELGVFEDFGNYTLLGFRETEASSKKAEASFNIGPDKFKTLVYAFKSGNKTVVGNYFAAENEYANYFAEAEKLIKSARPAG